MLNISGPPMYGWHSVCGLLHYGDESCATGVEDTSPCNCCGEPAATMWTAASIRPCGSGQWHVGESLGEVKAGAPCPHTD